MANADAMTTLRGGCHCGRLRVEYGTGQDPAKVVPRACDCSFCSKHGAAYVSDPAGTLSISARGADAMREYRQGSDTACFLICNHCGVLVAVVFEHDARLYGAANAACLDADNPLGEPVRASPQQLNPQQKVARWLQVWVPDVELDTGNE